jgi:hypothetical protein
LFPGTVRPGTVVLPGRTVLSGPPGGGRDLVYSSAVSEQAQAWHAVLARIIDGAHTAGADDLSVLVDRAVAEVGMSVRMYLIDLGQGRLHPVREASGPSLGVDSTAAGRAFRLTEIVPVRADDETHLWLPLLNGTERLGVLRVTLPEGVGPHDGWLREQCWVLAGLLGHLVTSKLQYCDLFHVLRRPRPLSVASELLWQLLPPQTFAAERVVVTAVMEPYDHVGGDGYDYAVDGGHAWVAVFDAMGHDLLAGVTTAVALAATRNARRAALGLTAAAELADEAISQQAGVRKGAFATAFLADLDLETGVLEYLIAGHPPPVVLRGTRMVAVLDDPVRLPLGFGRLDPVAPRLGRTQLEPGDRILVYSDGVTEARGAGGAQFGLDRLVDLTERHQASGLPAPETLRRVVKAVLDHQDGHLQDDATLLLLEWTERPPEGLLPAV